MGKTRIRTLKESENTILASNTSKYRQILPKLNFSIKKSNTSLELQLSNKYHMCSQCKTCFKL